MLLELFHGIKVKNLVNNEHSSSHVNVLLYVIACRRQKKHTCRSGGNALCVYSIK
jgi:hypothetical protein